MKVRDSLNIVWVNKILNVNFCFLFITLIFSQMAFAQSEKVSDHLKPNPSPTPEIAQTTEQSNCSSDGKPERYKYIISRGIKRFADKLNENGKCGYKLDKITKFPLSTAEKFDEMTVAGILKLDAANRFEYEWFEAFTPGEVVREINIRAKLGFYFRDILPVALGLCGSNSDNSSSDKTETEKILDKVVGWMQISVGDIYFLERTEAIGQKREYRLLTGTLGWGKKPAKELQASLDDAVKEGFYPVSMGGYTILGRWSVGLLVEKNGEKQNEGPDPQYQFIRSEFGFEKKVNRSAKAGFRLISEGEMVAFRHALMLKDNSANKPRSYKWIDTLSKSYLRDPANVWNQGAIYHSAAAKITGCDLTETRLVFQQEAANDQNRAETKILNMSDYYLTSPAEAMIEFNKLVEDGYVVRDMFIANGVNVLFERAK